MSWLDQVNTGIIITTGDGKVWEPIYDIAPLTVPYNIAEFEFVQISGTLVKRSKRKGYRHTLTFYFRGDNNLDVTNQFKKSANDERPWTISHPMHGEMLMQPSSIQYDPTGLATMKITVELIETITDEVPRVSVDPTEQIQIDVAALGETTDEAFAAIPEIGVSDSTLLTNNIDGIYDLGAEVVEDQTLAEEYFNAFNEANANILNITSDALSAIQSVRSVIEAPALFATGVKQRLSLLGSQLTSLVSEISNLTTFNQKTIFENNATSILGAMVTTVINPIQTDYENTTDVLDVIDTLSSNYDTLISSLDTLQTETGGETTSYVPDQSTLLGLSGLVDLAISELFNIALGAKQERVVYLEANDNVVSLAHRFLGLNPDDSNIEKFMNDNNIGLSELLQLKKGRQIKYYV